MDVWRENAPGLLSVAAWDCPKELIESSCSGGLSKRGSILPVSATKPRVSGGFFPGKGHLHQTGNGDRSGKML
jgi:hypothetical protein